MYLSVSAEVKYFVFPVLLVLLIWCNCTNRTGNNSLRIFIITGGHDMHAYLNSSFCRMVENAIRWSCNAGKSIN